MPVGPLTGPHFHSVIEEPPLVVALTATPFIKGDKMMFVFVPS